MDYSRAVLIACVGFILVACAGTAPGPRQAPTPTGAIIQLVFEDSAATSEYRCTASDTKQSCEAKGPPKVAGFQLSGTKHIFVTSECGGKFWRIQIEQAQSAKPVARVVCAQ